jgi:hypothetical protein
MSLEQKHFSLVKPTVNTPFHIDFTWWKQHDNNWRVFLHSLLCPEHQQIFADLDSDLLFDSVDPVTAEVKVVDGLQHILVAHCIPMTHVDLASTSLVDAVFRIFLSNGNTPLTPAELSLRTSRPADIILRTFGGPQIYKGVRPCQI